MADPVDGVLRRLRPAGAPGPVAAEPANPLAADPVPTVAPVHLAPVGEAAHSPDPVRRAAAAGESADHPAHALLEWRSDDGVPLSARVYGGGRSDRTPLVCLPGLTRNARDFEALARHVANHPTAARQVIAFDYRGRGASGYAPPETYTPAREAEDVAEGLDYAGVRRAVFLGTSRGGILTLLLAVARPELVAGAVLNELGPTIDGRGLKRIARQMGAVRPMAGWDEAVAAVEASFRSIYPGFGPDDWRRLAGQLCRETADGVVFDYDPALARIFDGFDPDTFHLDLWPAFACLAGRPVMVIRGALSDLLTAATVEAMIRRHPGLVPLVVPDQGHAPVLWERSVLERIAAFLPA